MVVLHASVHQTAPKLVRLVLREQLTIHPLSLVRDQLVTKLVTQPTTPVNSTVTVTPASFVTQVPQSAKSVLLDQSSTLKPNHAIIRTHVNVMAYLSLHRSSLVNLLDSPPHPKSKVPLSKTLVKNILSSKSSNLQPAKMRPKYSLNQDSLSLPKPKNQPLARSMLPTGIIVFHSISNTTLHIV